MLAIASTFFNGQTWSIMLIYIYTLPNAGGMVIPASKKHQIYGRWAQFPAISQAWQEILGRMSPQLRRDTYREVNVHWVKKARDSERIQMGMGYAWPPSIEDWEQNKQNAALACCEMDVGWGFFNERWQLHFACPSSVNHSRYRPLGMTEWESENTCAIRLVFVLKTLGVARAPLVMMKGSQYLVVQFRLGITMVIIAISWDVTIYIYNSHSCGIGPYPVLSGSGAIARCASLMDVQPVFLLVLQRSWTSRCSENRSTLGNFFICALAGWSSLVSRNRWLCLCENAIFFLQTYIFLTWQRFSESDFVMSKPLKMFAVRNVAVQSIRKSHTVTWLLTSCLPENTSH